MDWQQKAAALNALSEIEVRIRKPGDWYVSQDVEIKDKSILRGNYGNGPTPEAAIEDHWRELVTEVPHGMYLVVRAYGGKDRRAVRWNGFMWEDYPEQSAA